MGAISRYIVTEPKRGRHQKLLENPDVRRWNENVARGAQATADNYLRILGLFLEEYSLSPAAFAKMNGKARDDLLSDHFTKMHNAGKAGSYAAVVKKAAISWLDHNGKKLKRTIKIEDAQATPTLHDERVPTQDELRLILLAASPRDRVSCALVAHAGLRLEVIGNYGGDDGLRIRDLPELQISGKEVKFEKIPTQAVVRPELSKAGHRYFTFLGEEGCGYLKEYLEARLRAGESLEPDTDLVSPAKAYKQFIRTLNIGDGIRKAIRGAGFRWRPYVLRAFFDTQLLYGESKGKVAHDYRVFWMGHTGSMEARYTTNKGRLPKEMVEDMREAYGRCEPFLSTAPTRHQADTQANVAKVMLIGLGYTEEDLAKVSFEDLDPTAFQELVRKKMGAGSSNGSRQKVVGLDDVAGHLAQGWTVAMALNHNQAVLNPPAFGPQ